MLPLQQPIPFSNYGELYDLIIPQDNLLRRINDLVDFSFILKELMDKYCQDIRPYVRKSSNDVEVTEKCLLFQCPPITSPSLFSLFH
jgi:hypothetical protein